MTGFSVVEIDGVIPQSGKIPVTMEVSPPPTAIPFSHLYETTIAGFGTVTDEIPVPAGKQATLTSIYIGGQDVGSVASRVYVYKTTDGVTDEKIFIGYMPGNEGQVFVEEVLEGSATSKFKVVRERLDGRSKIVFARVQGYMVDV